MKNITATIYLPRYLEQYLRHHYGSPVRFPARSMENELLRRLTTRPPSQGTAAPAPDESSARLTPIGVVLLSLFTGRCNSRHPGTPDRPHPPAEAAQKKTLHIPPFLRLCFIIAYREICRKMFSVRF